jgi:hypothetical protein
VSYRQPDLVLPVLKSKYKSVNSGNLSDTVTGSALTSFIISNTSSTIQQALVSMESGKFQSSMPKTKRGVSNINSSVITNRSKQ